METTIREFEPIPNTQTHVLVDGWFGCKHIWKAARDRGFLIKSGLKCNRSLRITDPQGCKLWQRVDDYAASLLPEQYQKTQWPSQNETCEVYAHVVRTRVRKLYTCQLVIACYALRYWASSDLELDTATLLHHITTLWDIEVLFSDAKDLLGLDQYQLMNTTAILRFWTLIMAAYTFLDEERARLHDERHAHIALSDPRREVQRGHWRHLLDWIHHQFSSGVMPDELFPTLVA